MIKLWKLSRSYLGIDTPRQSLPQTSNRRYRWPISTIARFRVAAPLPASEDDQQETKNTPLKIFSR